MNNYKADVARSQLAQDFVVLTVDLQQIIFTPGLTNSEAFYLKKFANYNLEIYRSNDKGGFMNLWTELDGSKGSNEVSSAIWNFVLTHYPVTQFYSVR